MADVKKYTIQINGLNESISAVDALNESLKTLESRIKAVENKVVNVSSKSSGGGSKSSSTSSLSEEEKLEKQIAQIEEKRVAYGKQIYQDYLAQKDLLKEQVNDQKTIAASERQMANSYSNTIQGMKQELADIKTVMQTVDLGDTGQFDQLVQRANELNNKLKEIEQSYGQFGRNVGNYSSAFDGMQKLSITIGGVTREFSSAREASKTLKNELIGLEAAGQGNTEVAKELRAEYYKLQSAMDDATKSSKAMDEAMDMMQSFTAMASVGQGFKAFFGFDESEIQKSIQRLVALQNVLKGIEVINKQIQTNEGVGKWIKPFTTNIDAATKKLLVYNRALLGTGTAAKVAATGIKLFSKALKAIVTGGILLALDIIVEKLVEIVDSFKKVDEAAERTKKTQEEVNKAYAEASAKITEYTARVKNFNGNKQQEKKLVEELNRELGSSLGTYSSLAKWMDVLINKGKDYITLLTLQAKAQAAFNNLVEAQQAKMKFDNSDFEDYERWYDGFLEFVGSGGNARKREKAIGKQIRDDLSAAEKGVEDANKELQEFMQKKGVGDYSPQIEKGGKKTAATTKKVDDELAQLRIANMKEGLNKVLKQLEEERKLRLAKLESNDKYYEEKKAEINKLYDGKILDAKKKWAEDVEKTYKSMWDNIYSYSIETASKIVNLNELTTELNKGALSYNKGVDFAKDYSGTTYGIQGSNQLSKGAIAELDLEKEVNKDIKTVYQNRIKIIREYWEGREQIENEAADAATDETYEYWKGREQIENEGLNAMYESQISLENKRFEKEKSDNESHFKALGKQFDEYLDKEKISLEEYDKLAEGIRKEFYERDETIEKTHTENLSKIQREREDNAKKIRAEYYQDELQEIRDFQTAINNLENSLPVYNSWGLINISETKKNNEELLESYTELAKNILKVKKKLKEDLENNKITFDDFQNAIRELNALLQQLGIKVQETKKKLSFGNQLSEFLQSAEVYIQAGVQAFNQIMDAAFDAWNNAIDKEQEQLDKENEMLEKKLDEQEEIIEEHKNNVDSIEDELATARGDRRQHLIDQLNAEITAQRAAEAEKKRIQKEQEANEKKQDALELKRKKLQYKQQLLQAIVNGAMSVTYAAMNSWPVPAIPLMAAAGAATAAQIAIMSANKPYAKGGQLDGGVAVGNRHRDGGIKVLGGRAEIEGGEFITNRISTQMNTPLLEFINSKKKKIDASDLIDFYSSGKVKKNIQSISPKTKYADGGYLPPTLSTNIDINDRLIDSFERYSNRPVVVSVKEILNTADSIRRVETLAGLSPSSI